MTEERMTVENLMNISWRYEVIELYRDGKWLVIDEITNDGLPKGVLGTGHVAIVCDVVTYIYNTIDLITVRLSDDDDSDDDDSDDDEAYPDDDDEDYLDGECPECGAEMYRNGIKTMCIECGYSHLNGNPNIIDVLPNPYPAPLQRNDNRYGDDDLDSQYEDRFLSDYDYD